MGVGEVLAVVKEWTPVSGIIAALILAGLLCGLAWAGFQVSWLSVSNRKKAGAIGLSFFAAAVLLAVLARFPAPPPPEQPAPELPLGTIVSSALSPNEFVRDKRLQDLWVPADGREAPKGSKYAEMRREVPDLRGLFVRGFNRFDDLRKDRADKWSDPGPRDSNHHQDDSIGTHQHRFNKHHLDGPFREKQPNSLGVEEGQGLPDVFQLNSPNEATGANIDAGPETRPKNLGVFYYVKVN